LKVGDIVKIEKDTEFPADILLLQAAQGKDLVFIDTMNLDGETNLKERFVASKEDVKSIEDVMKLRGYLECDPPHESLDEWDGNMHFTESRVVNANIKNMLLRGCYLRNIDYAIGLVVYVGNESKIMMNAK
jgi:phospholipid-translocating ATPase